MFPARSYDQPMVWTLFPSWQLRGILVELKQPSEIFVPQLNRLWSSLFKRILFIDNVQLMFYSSDYADGFCSITSMVVCLVQFLFQRYVNICIMLFVAERHMICPDGSSFRGSLRIRDSPQIDSWKTIMISLFFSCSVNFKNVSKNSFEFVHKMLYWVCSAGVVCFSKRKKFSDYITSILA